LRLGRSWLLDRNHIEFGVQEVRHVSSDNQRNGKAMTEAFHSVVMHKIVYIYVYRVVEHSGMPSYVRDGQTDVS